MPDMPQVAVLFVPATILPPAWASRAFRRLAPAFANAIAKLTGKRLRKLPFDLANA